MVITPSRQKILIVDDEKTVRRSLNKCLTRSGFSCDEACDAREAMDNLNSNPADLVILDIMMPGTSGSELLPEIKQSFPDTAVVMATAVVEPDTIINCMKNGALDYITKPFDVNQLVNNIEMVLKKRQLELNLKEKSHVLEGKVDQQARELQKLFIDAIESLISALEAKDKYTAGHSRRVTKIAVDTGQALGLSAEELENLRWAALLHDIGKIGIDSSVQNKPGILTPTEYDYILTHCSIGPSIVEPLVNETIVEVIRHHHDSYDGTGLNQKLRAEEIPLGARILAVADSFDAMTSDRPYRSAMAADIAIAEIKKCAGTQFDPLVVKAFLKAPIINSLKSWPEYNYAQMT
jgi:putative two-component system response regulator